MFIGLSIGLSEISFSQYNEYIEDGFNNNQNLRKYLQNKEIKKKIFIPNRLINIII